MVDKKASKGEFFSAHVASPACICRPDARIFARASRAAGALAQGGRRGTNINDFFASCCCPPPSGSCRRPGVVVACYFSDLCPDPAHPAPHLRSFAASTPKKKYSAQPLKSTEELEQMYHAARATQAAAKQKKSRAASKKAAAKAATKVVGKVSS